MYPAGINKLADIIDNRNLKLKFKISKNENKNSLYFNCFYILL